MAKHYYGNGKPVNVYRNQAKLAGYHTETKSGDSVSFGDTYNDVADVELTGNTVQMSDWYAKDGLSSQVQTVQGKNLFDKSKACVGVALGTLEGEFLYDPTYAYVDYLKVIPSTKYYKSGNTEGGILRFYDINKTYISERSIVNGTFTTPSNSYYIRTNTRVIALDTLQIEMGSTSTAYAPFVPNSPSPDYPSPVTSNLPAGTYKYTSTDGIYEFTLAEELRGIGSAVDTISFDRVSHAGFVDRNIQKKVFTTIPEWIHMSYDYPLYHMTSQALLMKSGKPFICTHYKTFVGSNNPDHTTTWQAGLGTSFWVRDDSFTSAAEMNAFCSDQYNAGTPLTYYYQLATPTKTPLTFTKVSSSSAPECPMTFLTNTPSLDYPAQVYDVNGDLISRGKNLYGANQFYEKLLTYNTLPANISKVTKDGRECIRLCNHSVFSSGANIKMYADGLFKPNTRYTVTYQCLQACVENGGTTYVGLLIGVRYTDGTTYSKEDKLRDIWTTVSYTTAANKTIEYIVYFYGTGGTPTYLDVNTLQIEEGITATAFEPDVRTTIPLPKLSKVGTVADSFAPMTGKKQKRISDWVTLDGSKVESSNPASGLSGARSAYTPASYPSKDNLSLGYKYDATALNPTNTWNADSCFVKSSQSRLYVVSAMNDTGIGHGVSISSAEIKAYFYGWKMCNADGTAPYYKSEVPYTPSTWAEWTKPVSITGDATGMEITLTGNSYDFASIPTAIKPSTKYGVLVVGVSGDYLNTVGLDSNATCFSTALTWQHGVGNKKIVATSKATITANYLAFGNFALGVNGQKAKIKDIRIFELPVGSQIEADFTNLTADQLAAKYTFNGLCPKNWKHIVGNQSEIDASKTAVLPTASYTGYTPYKMLYQLATPVEESYTPTPVPTYLGQTIIETDSVVKPTINAVVRVPD